MAAMLKDGGWWDASMSLAPPAYKMNSFATSHDHYLVYDVSGIPTVGIVAAAKKHIVEHGYGINGGFIGFWNSATAEQVEELAEWNTTSNYVTTPTIAALQSAGIMPEETFTAVGVPFIINDWVPEYYMLIVDSNVKPLHWRDVEGSGKDLITQTTDDMYKLIEEYRRYASVTVTQRGAGVAIYLNGASWSDPSFTYDAS